MVSFQLPLLSLARDWNALNDEEKEFIHYFSTIDHSCIAPVLDCYKGIGPKGYGTSLILARILKIKQRILSDRHLSTALRQHDLYRFVTSAIQPSHNTFTTLRTRLGTQGFVEIHKRFVKKAHRLGLLEIDIKTLPRLRRKGIIVVADSTFLITTGSTRGTKDEQGMWHFTDQSVSFTGKGHHKHKYPVGHKAHSLRTISGIPLVTLVSPAHESDQTFIIPLLEELTDRYPDLVFAYIILDRGYDAEEIHRDIYETFEIIPVIIRKKMVYPKGYTAGGYPLCPFGFTMKPKGIEYEHRRSKYACFKICSKAVRQLALPCAYAKKQSRFGYTCYTYFADGYRKYGPALPHRLIYKKLKPFRTGIERTFGLVKENRYCMETSNSYLGIDNVTMHVIEHDIVLTQDIIFDYLNSGKLSPVLNL